MDDGRAREEGQDHGLRPSCLQKGRLAVDHARIGRDLGRVSGEQWVPICETLEATMEREKHLCANVDLTLRRFTMLEFPPALNTPISPLRASQAGARISWSNTTTIGSFARGRSTRGRRRVLTRAFRLTVQSDCGRPVLTAESAFQKYAPSLGARRAPLQIRRMPERTTIAPGTHTPNNSCLGCGPANVRRPAHPQFPGRRRGRSGMEAGSRSTRRFPAS